MRESQRCGSVETLEKEYGMTAVFNTSTIEMVPTNKSSSWMAQTVVSNLLFPLIPNKSFAIENNTINIYLKKPNKTIQNDQS